MCLNFFRLQPTATDPATRDSEGDMRIATYRWGGRRHVGVLSNDAREIAPIDLRDRQEQVQSRGAQALLEHLAEGKDFPAVNGTRLPLSAVTLEAPLPRPRRNLWCVGRNYRAHAKELQGTSIQERRRSGKDRSMADRVHQGARVRRRAGRCDPPSRQSRIGTDRLRSRARGRDRPQGHEHSGEPRDGLRVGLHDRQRRHRARRADAACAMGYGQVVRHVLPDGAVARRRDRARRAGHARAAVGQRRTATGRAHRRPDLRHSDADRNDLARHHACTRATSSRPAHRPVSAWECSRRRGSRPETPCASRSMASACSKTRVVAH